MVIIIPPLPTKSFHIMNSSALSSPQSSRNLAHLTDETDENNTVRLRADEVAIILGFLCHQDIMRARVCTTWRDAAKKTFVPPSELVVRSERTYNAMRAMSTALPNLQEITLAGLGGWHIYSDGEEPDERVAQRAANYAAHDINILSSFSQLRALYITGAQMNGRYDFLFSFPLLQKLSIRCIHLRWYLEMLSGLPRLKVLDCSNTQLTGNLRSLDVLKDTLEVICIDKCPDVRGNFMDLADFPRLKELHLNRTNVAGDIRDISGQDFPALESLCLPATVHGGMNYQFQLIAKVPKFMHAIHRLLQRTPTLFGYFSNAFHWSLSSHSPDWYEEDSRDLPPPFSLQFVQAGTRLGWSWCTYNQYYEHPSCEINWLDPEPIIGSSEYATYVDDLQRIEQHIDFYRGYFKPPTEQQYRRLCEEFA